MSTKVQWLFDNFVQECEAYKKSPSTIRGYKANYTRMANFDKTLPQKAIGAINKRFIVEYTMHLTQSGLKTASVNSYLRNARVFLYWCMENEYIPRFKVPMVKEREQLKEPYNRNELSVLLRKPSPNDAFTEWRTWAIINWIIGLGSRASTVVNIKMEDIDLKAGTVFTRHNKNGRVYSLDMPPQLRKALMEYMRYRSMQSDYLFCGYKGDQLLVTSLNHSIVKYNTARGVEKKGIHLFRHSFGMLWAENGGDVFGLQKAFNHSDIRVTQKYVNLYGNKGANDRFLKYNPLENMK